MRCAAPTLVTIAVAVSSAATNTEFAGSKSCAKCHAAASKAWSSSRHSKMVQPASAAGVLGDFSRGDLTLRDAPYKVASRNGQYFITESYLTGKPVERKVDFTLGNRRIQHYLSKLPDGRIIVLPPTWDVTRKDWFHAFDIDDPEEMPGATTQIWNKMCYGCHVSQEKKNYDLDKNQYSTAWQDFGINCERCHGPGAEHAAFYSAPNHKGKPKHDVVLQSKLDAARNSAVCGQCHSFRDIYVDNFTAGDDYFDHFLPILEFSLPDSADPAYWTDGRPRRFSTDAFALWQSQCFLKGNATCLDCHVTPHNTDVDRNPQLRTDSNSLCTRCHAKLAAPTALSSHTHHEERSAGSSCIECHMPRTVFSIKAEIRDHALTVPVPENTIRHKIPNACNNCHKDKDAAWTLNVMNSWAPPSASRSKWVRIADAFAAGRDPKSASTEDTLAKLSALSADTALDAFTRANALGYLASRFSRDTRAFDLLETAASDKHPLVRSIAVRFLPQWSTPGTVTALTRALADPARTIRISAAVGLTALRVRPAQLPGDDAKRLEAALDLYRARIALNSDDPEQNLAAGRFFLMTAEPARAVPLLKASLVQDPTTPAQFLIAAAYYDLGDFATSRRILESIPPADKQYAPAQRLLRAIETKK